MVSIVLYINLRVNQFLDVKKADNTGNHSHPRALILRLPGPEIAHAVGGVVLARHSHHVGILCSHEHIDNLLFAQQGRWCPHVPGSQRLELLLLVLHRLVVWIDFQSEFHVFDAVIVTAKHLCVGWEGVSGKVHSSDHLSRRTLEKESTATVKDSVASEDATVHLPSHLGTLSRHLYRVLLALDGALLWLNEVAYRSTGVTGRMMTSDLHIVYRDYVSIGNTLRSVHHVALIAITLSRLVVLGATYNMDARV